MNTWGAMNINMQRICRDPITGRDIKESEDIHTPMIDVGGGLRTGCGSHPLSAERVEELEESV